MTTQPHSPDASPPPVIRATWVERPPEEAFKVFTDEIGAWWPLPTHGLFGETTGGVAFRNGRLVEQATDGRETVWGEVRAWEPPSRLVISWHPGRAEPDSSEVEVLFTPDGTGTRVLVEHRGWETFGAEATARRRSYVGPGAWGYVLDHYADGAEARGDAPDLSDLAGAYEQFFAEADRGGFAAPPDDEWSAEQVVAHVALNDAAMLGVCQALVHGKPLRFENTTGQDRAVLDRWIDDCGTPEVLVGRGRHAAHQVMAALSRLSTDQRATEVHCHLTHNGEIMAEGPRPWSAVAIDTQTTFHLPAHIEQLRSLRPG
ncbi:MAG: hypothetical protein GY929_00995 [Actinomycetia bacterium]|nr:hypothetical protein [Actinomycetes bacterium]